MPSNNTDELAEQINKTKIAKRELLKECDEAADRAAEAVEASFQDSIDEIVTRERRLVDEARVSREKWAKKYTHLLNTEYDFLGLANNAVVRDVYAFRVLDKLARQQKANIEKYINCDTNGDYNDPLYSLHDFDSDGALVPCVVISSERAMRCKDHELDLLVGTLIESEDPEQTFHDIIGSYGIVIDSLRVTKCTLRISHGPERVAAFRIEMNPLLPIKFKQPRN